MKYMKYLLLFDLYLYLPCSMYLFLYFLLFRKQKKQDALFATTLITALLYIIVIGIGYINVWAADNIVQTGEYMTGFERFMLPITSFLYAFILYSVGMRLVLNKK